MFVLATLGLSPTNTTCVLSSVDLSILLTINHFISLVHVDGVSLKQSEWNLLTDYESSA